MATVKTNIVHVGAQIKKKLGGMTNEVILRPVMAGVLDLLKTRIHIDGKASSGQQIGTYSAGYMKVRTGNFLNAEKFKKGKKAGKLKNSGTFTDAVIRLDKKTGVFTGEDKVGKKRPNYNRSSDPKVIISLTRQLENDYAIVPTPKGYAIGFKNPHNFDKSQWVQLTYKKRIFDLTKGEQEYVTNYVRDLIVEQLNSQ